MSVSHFNEEEGDIVRLTGDAEHLRGWVNVGTHAIKIDLDSNGNLAIEVCARTNEGDALATVIVTKEQSVAAGGVDPDAE